MAQQPASNGLAPESRKPVTQLIDRFLKERRDLATKTKDDYTATLTLLDQILKSKPIGEIDKNDIVAFKDTLLLLPRNYRIVFKTDDAIRAIRLNNQAKKPTLTAHTINVKYLSNLRTFFGWAEANNLIANNPATKVSVKDGKRVKASEQRDPFTVDELQKLFTSPLYMGCRSDGIVSKPGAHLVADHHYWAPLIGLFTGARLNEIGQLELADIVQHNNCWHFRITEETGETEPDKKLKTQAAKRDIPVHPALEELGFLDYVASLRKQGKTRLFPDWQKGGDGFYSSPMSKWFSRLLRDLGIKRGKISFHSFRHTYKDALLAAGIAEKTQDKVMGHANDSVQGRYGSSGLLETESAAIREIDFPGFMINHPRRDWPS
ncbi:MAG: site-specific integrase [Alphaproteobacteria bacterium]|nr:site-specific integrase [Alphaproteobacteria bacterium]